MRVSAPSRTPSAQHNPATMVMPGLYLTLFLSGKVRKIGLGGSIRKCVANVNASFFKLTHYPDFRVKVIETIVGDGNSIVVQAEMSGPIPADAGAIAKKGQVVHIPHVYILRFDDHDKIRRLDAYWDNTVLNSIQASAV